METQNYVQQQEQKAAENARKIEASAREKVAARMREADQKRQQEHAARMREEDRKRAEQARAREKQQQEQRAKAREYAKTKAAETMKKEVSKAKEQQQADKQMHGASQGPTMRQSSGNKQRDALEMAAEMDHPGLTDGQKAELARQGVSMGEGFKNREAKRLEEAAARESRKTPADKAADQMAFRAGVPYEKRLQLEIARDKRRVREIEQAKNNVLMPRKEKAQEQVKAQEKTPAKAPAKAPAKQFEFAKEQEEPTRGGR